VTAVAQGRRPGRRRAVIRVSGRGGRPLVSLRFDVRAFVVTGAVLLLVAAAVVTGLMLGDYPMSAGDVLRALVGQGSSRHEFIVFELRMPRILTALLVGAAFALSGALLQTLSRNALVAPDVIGINTGAALIAVGVIVLGLPASLIAPGAVAGAVIASVLLWVLSYRAGLSPYRLVLIGIAVNAGFAAGISYLLTYGRIEDVQRATVWLIGSVYGSD
jgi:iron complex transport system permease protein